MSNDQTTGPQGGKPTAVPNFPPITAQFRSDDTVKLEVFGVAETFTRNADGLSPRVQALEHLQGIAQRFTRPVKVATSHHAGSSSDLVVTPDGDFYDPTKPDLTASIDQVVDEEQTAAAEPAPLSVVHDVTDPAGRESHATDALEEILSDPTDQPGTQTNGEPLSEGVQAPQGSARPPTSANPSRGARFASAVPEQSVAETATPVAPTEGAAGPRAGRHSFIQTEIATPPAQHGWRGFLNRLGMRLGAGRIEREFRDDVMAVSEHWPGPRTIAVANPKGSANKTPTSALLAAVFARYGGAGVLAWDNNETRGSLAWRTQRARHVATVLELLPRVDDLLSPSAQAAELSHYTHHQPADKYDVLHSDQSVEGDHEVSALDVDRVHQVVSRYYRLIVMDSGNSERAANWRAMIQHSDALVMPCTNVEDTPEAGARMLEALSTRDDHSRDLAERAVVILSQRTPGRDANMTRIADGMDALGLQVIEIPFDPALKNGVIHFDALRPATQRAWLRAAAAVARAL